MKNLKFSIFILFVVFLSATFITSCQKDSLEEPVSKIEEITEPKSISFLIDNQIVDEHMFESSDNENLLVYGDKDGHVRLIKFSTEEKYLEFGDDHNIPLRNELALQEKLSSFAKSSGAIKHYEKTGEVLKEFKNYEEQLFLEENGLQVDSRNSTFVIIGDNCGGAGNASMVLPMHTPIMPLRWNNRMSEYFVLTPITSFHLYDRTFYRNRMATVWLEFGWIQRCIPQIPGLAAADNRTSSCLFF